MNHWSKNASPQLRIQTTETSSPEIPYLKTAVIPDSSHMPMALVILYTIVLCALGAMMLANTSSQHSHQRSMEQMDKAIEKVTEKVAENNVIINKLFKERTGVEAFVEKLKESGIDPANLVPSESK